MLLNSVTFLIFLSIVAIIYLNIGKTLQNPFLLAASLVFYILGAPQYAAILAFTIVVAFIGAIRIEKATTEKNKDRIAYGVIIYSVLVLVFFKYINIFSEQFLLLISGNSEGALSLILPIGISFYTFQLIGYILDVRRGKIEAEKDFIVFAMFMSFFPQIISGPIGRSTELLPQYKQHHKFDYSRTVEGLQRFLQGAFKKIVVADGLAVIVDGYFGVLNECRGMSLVVAMLLYSIQLYADFSGYTDMAIGSAKIIGISLRENFCAPYLSKNYSSFWSRWHISLSSWLQDYIFTPLVWSRWFNKVIYKKSWEQKAPHFLANIFIVFLISGIWHGAAPTFVIWGILQGLFRIGEEIIHKFRKRPIKIKNKILDKLRNASKIIFINLLWIFSLVFFRAPTVSEAFYILQNIFLKEHEGTYLVRILDFASKEISRSSSYYLLFFSLIAFGIIFIIASDFYASKNIKQGIDNNPIAKLSKTKRWIIYWALGLATATFYLIGMSGAAISSQFLYMGY